MDKIFLQILNMSSIASIVIIFVLIARVFLRKVPKIFSYALWFVVLFRLICPFSFESVYSLLPIKENLIPQDMMYDNTLNMDVGVTIINHAVHDTRPSVVEEVSIHSIQVWMFIGSVLWLIGIGGLFFYSFITFFRLKQCLKTAVAYKNNIFLSDRIETAFVIGIFSPRIYLPFHLKESEQEYILLHEQTHIKRLDHVIRFISFLVLCVHWFNPFVWIAFFASGKDMEMSCDEAVIRKIGKDKKKEYSISLLNLAIGRKIVGGTPISFGEGDTKSRIKNVLNYRKPTFWGILFTVLIVLCIGIGLLVDPIHQTIFVKNKNDISKICIEQIYEGESLGKVEIHDESDMEVIWNALSHTNKTLKQSVNDFPYEKNYFKIESFGANSQILYLYKENNTYYVEEPYIGIYKTKKKTYVSIENIYNSNKDFSTQYNTVALWKSRILYIGDGSGVGNIVNQLPFPDGYQYKSMELDTKGKQRKLIINCKEIENVELSSKEEFIVKKNAILLLALIDNLEELQFVIQKPNGENNILTFDREWANKEMSGDLRGYTKDFQKFKQLINLYSMHSVGEPLEHEIHLAILDSHKNDSMATDLACENHVILATETKDKTKEELQKITIYAMVLYEEYNLVNGKIEDTQEVVGSHTPTAITFEVGENGQYFLSEYWIPGDGSNYNQDIKNKFPKEVWKDALDTQKYITVQQQSIYQKLMEGGYLDAEEMITKSIDHMIQIKKEAPDWEIEAEQRNLTYYGDAMLTYAYRHFLKGKQRGEKAYIMETACRDLLKQFQEDMKFQNKKGQEWFDAYLAALKEYKETKGIEFVKENMPKGYLLLMMNEN
ncbi:MAG: DUF5301 domain-containing protein [Firmicutes bacterium]|uniref:DUF5301 domain-containing protein n=1 Tax=Candidatus Scybalomonas excrementavium TaxID=2840943 RepID=A0A9D9I1J8_9FIRM|nr:DUF5301 domain-containing protein [Candidatus Scybalomonas excrementavium]